MKCPNCGGQMIGDGYTSTLHCENIIEPPWDLEPDAEPVYCNQTEPWDDDEDI